MSDDGITISIDGDSPSSAATAHRSTEPGPQMTTTQELARARAEQARVGAQIREAEWRTANSWAEAAQAEANSAEMEYRTAADNADTAAMAAAQRKMARAEAVQIHATQARAALERAPQVPSDPVEQFCQGRTPRTAQWVRERPDYITDPRKHNSLQAAHYEALANGHTPDTDGYFAAVEKFIDGDGKSSTRTRQSTTSCPSETLEDGTHVYRGKGEVPPGTVHLTKKEYEAATDGSLTWESGPNRGKPLGLREYVRRRQLMDKDPRWQRLGDF
jgi:hypothetical protein